MGDTAPPAGLVGHEAVIEGHPPLTDAGQSGEDLAGIFYTGGDDRDCRARPELLVFNSSPADG
jgi:hypothetical protein